MGVQLSLLTFSPRVGHNKIMNLKCIDNKDLPNALTVGREYKILGGEGPRDARRYIIRDDQHHMILVESYRFEAIPPPNCS